MHSQFADERNSTCLQLKWQIANGVLLILVELFIHFVGLKMGKVSKSNLNNKTCFICGRICSKDDPIHTFTIPAGKFDQWSQIVNGLQPQSKLCHTHFKPEHINNGKFILGKFHPSPRWLLTKDAEPQPHLLSPSPVGMNYFHLNI